jgi:hypothetical protein
MDVHDAIEDFLAMSIDEDGPPEPIRRTLARSEIVVLDHHSHAGKEKTYAALVVQAKTQGRVFEPKPGMQYIGAIKEISACGQFAIQDQGRGAVVIHDLSKLEGRFAVGQKAHITYRNGTGKGKLQTVGQERTGARSGAER